ncbi:MAG TPA: hypothetical protein VLG92_05735 [Candidatus Saccharimonadia bacterium]|nr:hypothetical protein [Candidatus Saccharimonadia bacterium]
MAIDYRIADATVYCSLLGYLAAGLLYEARRPNDRTGSGRIITQRRRYAFLVASQSASTVGQFWLLWVASPHDLLAAAKGWLVFGPPGWIVDLGMAVITSAPLLWICVFIRIYCHPVPMAFKRFGCSEYCTLTSYRSSGREFVGPVVPMTEDDLDGSAFADATPDDFGAPPS